MMRRVARLGLPLLAKELIEQAARKRTYVIRVVYASLLFFTAFLFFYNTLRVTATSPLAVLGRGRDMFATLVALQFTGIYFFMPAMTCSVLTQEKERASLQLLFLTRLGPWTILFEKLASRLVPMFCYLLLSLPLLAFAYTLGGISPGLLLAGVWILVVATVQMGTLALACSAFFRTTAAAFIWSYLLTVIFFFGPGLFWLTLWSLTGISVDEVGQAFGLYRMSGMEVLVFPLFGPVTFFGSMQPGMLSPWVIFSHSVLVLGMSAACLLAARLFIVRRAFLPSRDVMLNVFKMLDRTFLRLNENPLTRGFVFIGDTAPLPGDKPVAWRETAKRSLGKARYLLRVFLAIEIPVATLCMLMIGADSSAAPMTPLLFLVWIVAGLMVSAQSATLIAGERSHQTLEVLCTTPLAGKEIVHQKFRAVERLMLVLLVPFFTIFGFECAMKWNMPDRWNWGGYAPLFRMPLYLVVSFLSVAIYLPLFAWLSFLIGLKVRTQARAIAGSMAAILGWCALPLVFIELPLSILFPGSTLNIPYIFQLFTLASPVSIIAANEGSFRQVFATAPWLTVFLNFIPYALLLVLVRWLCLTHADRLLGRSEARLPDVDFAQVIAAAKPVSPAPASAASEP